MMRHRRRLVILAAVSILPLAAPAWSQCTKDTDCKYGRICKRGRCVEGNAPSTEGAPPWPPAPARPQSAQKVAACRQKCEHEYTKCMGKKRGGVSDCVSYKRDACLRNCLRGGGDFPPYVCTEHCNASRRREAWEYDCANENPCQRDRERCDAACEYAR
jgi:hypothetical protein